MAQDGAKMALKTPGRAKKGVLGGLTHIDPRASRTQAGREPDNLEIQPPWGHPNYQRLTEKQKDSKNDDVI